ncbi:MAG: PEGA domain-containing protein [Vicinamibacterales bacterium]
MRAPVFVAAASVIASITILPAPADAQVRVARPRTVVGVRPVVVSRPTVFIGGYYYPTFYRASLWYDPWGPGYFGYGAYPYYYQYPIYGPRRYDASGSVRVQVSPRQSEVFVDGYFAGTADDFDGVFQRLNIEPGEHEIVIYLEGHRPFSQRFYLQPGKSFNIRHTMEPLGPGEAAPPRPQTAPLPGRAGGPRYDNGGPVGPPEARGAGAGRGAGGGRGRQGGPAVAEGFGSLSLRVQPADAQVLIDGEVWQGSLEGERLVIQLGAGTHHVEIRKDGYRNYRTDIPIGNGQVRTLNVALTKQ